MNPKELKKKLFFYNNFAEEFDSKVNLYDTFKRIDVIFNILLKDYDIKNKKFLDGGSGTGWLSEKAFAQGADVIAIDIGFNLLNKVKEKVQIKCVNGDVLSIPFNDNSFDFVVSSEVIEHTPDPIRAVRELVRVTSLNGIIVITTPNKIWHFSVALANLLNLRPYKGLENWISYKKLKLLLEQEGCEIMMQRGIHIAPLFFSRFFIPFLEFMDRYSSELGPIMLNSAIIAMRKK